MLLLWGLSYSFDNQSFLEITRTACLLCAALGNRVWDTMAFTGLGASQR